MNRSVYTSNDTLSLVEYWKSDDRALYENWCDPETQKGYNGIYFDSFEEYEKRDSLRSCFFAMIQLNDTGEIIGAVGVSPPETVPDLAIWIFKPYRKQGYGTLAFVLATNYAVKEMGITELHAGAYPDNAGSRKILAKCGYVLYPEGNIPEKHYITGEDIIQMDYIWGGNKMTIEKYFCIDRDIVQQMIAATENMTHEKTGDNGFQATKVFLFDEYAILKMQNINFRNVTTEDKDLKHLERIAGTLLDLKAEGVNVIPILAFQCENGNGYIVQQRAKGAELYDRHKASDKAYVLERVTLLSNAPQEHYDKFIRDTIKIIVEGVIVDFIGKDNFFYDEKTGFQFIDLNAHFDYVYGVGDKFSDETIKQIVSFNCFLPCYFDTVPKYRDTVTQVLVEMTDNERSLLCERNRIIFGKCKSALITNGISAEMINRIIADESFIPQKHQVGLCTDSGVMNWWDNRSDEYYGGIQNGLDDIFDRADRAFPIVVWDMIHDAFPDLRGKRVLVPSSGDNIAVFGFHLLGASVTSCDISERQLYNAKKVADRFDWNIEFIRQDSMELSDIPDDTYDLVYTSNGVHVWIPNLPRMYGNFSRVLKPDGKYIMFETHPFCRPFDISGTEIKVKKPYTDTGPFVSEVKTGTITEFGWRIMDLFNAVFDNGFTITHMEEFSPGKDEYDNYFYSHQKEAKEDDYKRHDWKLNPWAALPQCIGFTARKGGEK